MGAECSRSASAKAASAQVLPTRVASFCTSHWSPAASCAGPLKVSGNGVAARRAGARNGSGTRVVARAGRRGTSSKARGKKSADKLTAIEGVGPKTETFLADNGIASVPSLHAWYEGRVDLDSEELVEALCSLPNRSTGVLRAREAKKVIEFLRPAGDAAAADSEAEKAASLSAAALQKAGRGLTLCVEGNIGVGKTTFLQKLIGQSVELQQVVEVVPEPVEQWQNVGDGNINLLEMFYNDQRRYAYTFQHYVFVTRVMQEKHSREHMAAQGEANKKSLRLLERSVFSDRMVFVRAVHEAKCMSDVELSIYDSWFSPMVSVMPTLVPDGFIYLKADPRTCLMRMGARARDEEGRVSLDYLENLHSKHEDWLSQGQHGERPNSKSLLFPSDSQLSAAGTRMELQPSNLPDIPTLLQDKLVHMNKGRTNNNVFLPSELNNLPALVLDYDVNIDIDHDEEARNEYAAMVKAYMEYIKQYKQAMDSPQLLIPRGASSGLYSDLSFTPGMMAQI
eukprot:jgi/Tetstr1/460984/TSEL_006136.t1